MLDDVWQTQLPGDSLSRQDRANKRAGNGEKCLLLPERRDLSIYLSVYLSAHVLSLLVLIGSSLSSAKDAVMHVRLKERIFIYTFPLTGAANNQHCQLIGIVFVKYELTAYFLH